jgi:xanthine dehydrogenase accessory factor
MATLQREGTPFALATVVARKAPVSSHLGDAAIVFEDGSVEGYIGGGCSQEILRTQALEALRTGEPRLVRISPDDIPGLPGYPDDGADPQYVRVSMTCASQGAVDLYLEPYAPLPLLVVIGAMPIAAATAEQGALVGFDVLRVRDPDESGEESDLSLERLSAPLESLPAKFRTRRVFGVVASMGEYDDVGMDALLRAKAPYIALVASRPRADAVLDALRSRGWSDDDVAVIHNPAGLDIGAKTAPEVALSILAEIVRWRRQTRAEAVPTPRATAKDPVCGMDVTMLKAPHTLQIEDRTYYFCSPGCKRTFAASALETKRR